MWHLPATLHNGRVRRVLPLSGMKRQSEKQLSKDDADDDDDVEVSTRRPPHHSLTHAQEVSPGQGFHKADENALAQRPCVSSPTP